MLTKPQYFKTGCFDWSDPYKQNRVGNFLSEQYEDLAILQILDIVASLQYYVIFIFRFRVESRLILKVHKNENFFGFDFEFCTISVLVMHK